MPVQEALRREHSADCTGSALPCVHMHHFEAALSRVQPSVSPRDHLMYESLRQKLRRCGLGFHSDSNLTHAESISAV